MKKLLALVLALVMTLSLCVASNAAYADAADIDYPEAVDVMSAIGVLQGDGTNFNPDGILTRAEACTIIAKLLGMGSYVGTSNFSDCKGHWGESAIALCAGEGIVDGVGGGKFEPNGKLTGYAFAKMLLVALGYDAAIEGMTGSDWTIGTAKLIKSQSLNDGIDGFVGSAEVSREVAAQMALNALQCTEVYYSRSQSVTNKGEISTNTSLQTSFVSNKGTSDFGSDHLMQLVDDYFPKLVKTSSVADDFGRPATKWTYKNVKIGTYTTEPSFTYTAKQSSKAAKAAVKETFKDFVNFDESADEVPYVLNGFSMGYVTFNEDWFAGIAANGRLVEVYTKDNKLTKVVAVDTVLGKVTTVDKTSEKITVKGLFGGTEAAFAATSKGYGTFVKDDYVLLTLVDSNDGTIDTYNSTIKTVAAATKVTGKAATKNASDKTITLDGTTYKEAATVLTSKNVAAFGVSSKYDATLYTDANGYVYYAKGGVASVDNKAVLVLEGYKSLDKNGKLVNMIKGVTADGETVVWQAAADYSGSTYEDKVWEYSESSDVYTLSSASLVNTTSANMADGKTSDVITLSSDIKEADKTFTTSHSQKLYFDSAVKFIYLDAANSKAAVKEGVQKVVSGTKATLVVEEKDSTNYVVAVYVYAAAKNTSTSVKDVVFVDASTKTTGGYSMLDKDNKVLTFDTYDAYIEGVKLDLFYTDDTVAADGFYTVEIDQDNGDYKLTGNKINTGDNDDLSVSAEETYVALVGDLLSGTNDYDISGATFVDLTSHDYADFAAVKDAIDNTALSTAKFMVIYNYDDGVASYVYLTSIA